jgi:hypothetical protein
MKYFVCALGKTNIGIPSRQTQQIISVTGAGGAENENQSVFISLPELFQQKDAAHHGLVLKTSAGEPYKVRTVLLTPKIDAELEIPEEDIHSLPKAMSGVYRHFTGAYCADQKIILILNPEKIIESGL